MHGSAESTKRKLNLPKIDDWSDPGAPSVNCASRNCAGHLEFQKGRVVDVGNAPTRHREAEPPIEPGRALVVAGHKQIEAAKTRLFGPGDDGLYEHPAHAAAP